MDILGKALSLGFSLMILGQAYLVRRHVGTWLFPACLFGLFWFGYTFVPLSVLFWVPVQPIAVAFIFLCTLAFSLASVPFDWASAIARNKRKSSIAPVIYGSRFLRVVFHLSTLASLVFLALDLSDQAISIHDLVFDLQGSALAYANLLYSESLKDNMFGRISTLFAYLGPILGGLLFSCMRSQAERFRVIVFSFLPAILVALTETTKGLLFLCIVFFYAGLLVYRASTGNFRLLEKGDGKTLVSSAAIVLLVITTAFLLRGLNAIEDNELLVTNLISHFASYSCSHLYAFSDWFSSVIGRQSELVYPHEAATHGFYTFMSLFQLLGSDKVVPQGVFDDYYSYGNLLNGNLFTMYRGLILDFGFAGSVLFMLLTGILFHWAFYAMLVNKRPVSSVAIFVFMMGYFYLSFVVSALSWNRFYIAFVLLCITLEINKLLTQPMGRRYAHPTFSADVIAVPRHTRSRR